MEANIDLTFPQKSKDVTEIKQIESFSFRDVDVSVTTKKSQHDAMLLQVLREHEFKVTSISCLGLKMSDDDCHC